MIGRAATRRGALVTIAGLYVALLAVSSIVRAVRVAPERADPDEHLVELPAVGPARRAAAAVDLAYREVGGAAEAGASPVLLLHGSPGSNDDFARFVPLLGEKRRVIAPDLPGFGGSSRAVPDYSIAAHAGYVLELLDRLAVERVHVVAYSMGGGVALELHARAPARVRSLTMLSAIGVQELELFGHHRTNRAVHGAQLALLWLAREGLPHMGLLDDAFFGVPYARNFYDSDQRPLRGILERFEPPMLILHGSGDFLVPPQAAREHARIVPQAELELFAGDHFTLFLHPERLAPRVSAFLDRVEAGEVASRAGASPERVAAARLPFDARSIPPLAGIGLALMLVLLAAATLVSEDLACVAAGLLVAQGRLAFGPAVAACFAGILVGDFALYFAGRWLGRPALAHRPLRWVLAPGHLDRAARWFERRGAIAILLSRFFPGTRLPTYFAAGVLRTRFAVFALYFAAAVALWTPLLVGLAVKLGERALVLVESLERYALVAGLLVAGAVLVILKGVLPLFSFRGRRRLVGRWRRLVRWEFWPPWAFYPPVALWVLFLGAKHRSPLLFTAANPAIEDGGFVAESKGRILDGLRASPAFVARTGRIPAAGDLAARVSAARGFLEREGLRFPVVLKPDAGQRGSGVAVVRDAAQLERYIAAARFETLIQEHVPGHEFGIFYCREPREPRGRIFSITDKRMPFVVGDGRHDLERLILRDRRAICMADHYLSVQAARLDEVPAAGERVPLVELGTHCRGAVFLDGTHLRTPALEARIDAISRGFEGFYFGRYDVRAESPEALALGEGFRIIELNGVTSEATDIYDPRNGLLDAYRKLFAQWRLAFEIGRQNRERGCAPSSPSALLRRVLEYRRAARTHAASAAHEARSSRPPERARNEAHGDPEHA